VDKFQYFLTDEDGRFYSLLNDTLTTSVEPVPLPQSPSGWQDVLIGWERDMTKFGVIRNFSLPLSFVLDGARIIRELFYSSNIEKEIHLVITKLNLDYSDTSYDYYYSKFYEGELDLSTFKDDGVKVTLNIAEGSYAKKLKANEGTQFEVPVEGEAIRVKMDGLYLYQSFNYIVQTGPISDNHLLGIIETTREGGASGLASFTVYQTRLPGTYSTVDYSQRVDYFLSATQNISNIRIKGSIKFSAVQNYAGYSFLLRTTTGRDINLITNVGPGVVNFDKTFDVFAGENVFFVGLADLPIVYEETNIRIDFKSKYPDTYIKAYKPYDFFSRLSNKVLGASIAQSDLLTNNANLCITSGDAVRGIEGSKIKTSLNSFFEAYNVMLNAGMSLENNALRIESKASYFNTTNPISLGEVKDFKFSVATDLIPNTIKIGYPVQNTDDVNGKYAFNNTHIYTAPQSRIVKELTLQSSYITDPYAIELYRINLEGKTTTDDSNDNDVMVLNVDIANPQTDDLGTYYNLKRETYTTVTGLPDPNTTFNIEQLTPKRLLKTHQSWIDSIFYGFEGELLKFQTTEKNADLYTDNGVVYDENADFEIGTSALLLPYYLEFDTQVPVDLAVILKANPNRCFTCTWEGGTWEGFLIKAGIAPNDNKAQAFKLLLTPNNDLTRLI
jgi:hypothetical protein